MNRSITTIFGFALILHLFAQSNTGEQLKAIFQEAEQCYLLDDYQQLESCLNKYYDVYNSNLNELGDSTDIYSAYYLKMCGAYYYGFAENPSNAFYSEYNYKRSFEVFRSRNNVSNELVLREELAQLYYKMKEYGQTKAQLDSICLFYDNRLHDLGIMSVEPNYFKTLSQLAICNARLGNYDLALSQIDKAINTYFKKHKDANYYEALRKRGKILMLQADSLGNTHFKKAVDCYRQYIYERYAAIANEMNTMTDIQKNQFWLATHQFLYDCFRLGNLAPEMLYDLTLFSKDYLVRKDATQTKWKQVKMALGKKECAIEFVQYYGKDDERRLGCLLLKDNSVKPIFIDLFSTDSLLSLPLTSFYTIGSAITESTGQIKDELYNDPRLSQTIWSRTLLNAIGDAQKIYFAPDGLLNQLAIEYLMPDTTKTCYRLTSTRLLTQKRTTPRMDSALLCGGIEYGAEIQPNDRNNDVVAYRFLASQEASVKALEWTKKEVEAISAIRNNPGDTLLEGTDATDKALLQLLKRNYAVIHISTHGYFGGRIGIYNDLKPLLNDESMSKSGLLFAGSEKTLTDKNFDEDLFDGVLSAKELSKQDLSKTELIILSACQTGLGHLTDDGIYGIQRGLKIAGANAMILSLWNVDDYSSCLLMQYFYEELEKQSSKDIRAAFQKARQRLGQKEYFYFDFDPETLTYTRKNYSYNTPKHTNPFIIIDAF